MDQIMEKQADDAGKHFDLSQLLEETAENYNIVRAKIRQIRVNGKRSITVKVSARHLQEIIQEKHPSYKDVNIEKINNFIFHQGGMTHICYQTIVSHLWDLGAWSNNNQDEKINLRPDALFHALTDFLDIRPQTLNNLVAEIPGLYRVWRASMHVPGSYVCGMIEISHKKDTGALWAVETHVFKGENDVISAREVFEGYMIKKSRYYVIISRQTRDHSGPPRVTLIYNTLKDTSHITALYGMVMGCYGSNALFSAPVYMERAEKKTSELLSELEITDKIPSSVSAKLQVRVDNGIIRF
jgi:hypothetical protein